MSGYAELARATRQPLREWWASTGVWWLIGVTVARLISQALGIYMEVQPDGYHAPDGAVLIVGDMLGLVGVLGTPLVWLLAGRAVVRAVAAFPTPDAELSAAARSPQAVFPVLVMQGVWPLLTSWCIFACVRCGSAYWSHPVALSGAEILQALDAASHSIFMLLPVMLVALSLLAVVRRPWLSLGLIVIQPLAALAWEFVHREIRPRPHLAIGLVPVELLISMALLAALLSGLRTNRKLLWRSAYGAILVSLPLAPLLYLLHHRFGGRPLLITYDVVNAVSYGLFSHGKIGHWLSAAFAEHVPVSDSVLGFAAPAILDAWYLVLCGGLFALLYWLLGRPVQRDQGRPSMQPETSAVLA